MLATAGIWNQDHKGLQLTCQLMNMDSSVHAQLQHASKSWDFAMIMLCLP